MVQTASDWRAFFGHSSRRVQGVRIRPMKYTPASNFSGNEVETSPARMPNSSSAMMLSHRVDDDRSGHGPTAPPHHIGCIKISLCLSSCRQAHYLGPRSWEWSHHDYADRFR